MEPFSQSMYDHAKQAALLIMEKPDMEEYEWGAELVAAGIPRAESCELIIFLPLAFGRRAFRDSGVTFQPNFALMKGQRRVGTLPLHGQAAYCAACAVAEDFYGQGVKYDVVAKRSAELRAINALLQKGSELQNICMTPPFIDARWLRVAPQGSWWHRCLLWLGLRHIEPEPGEAAMSYDDVIDSARRDGKSR